VSGRAYLSLLILLITLAAWVVGLLWLVAR
jgi:hypothetical protein